MGKILVIIMGFAHTVWQTEGLANNAKDVSVIECLMYNFEHPAKSSEILDVLFCHSVFTFSKTVLLSFRASVLE